MESIKHFAAEKDHFEKEYYKLEKENKILQDKCMINNTLLSNELKDITTKYNEKMKKPNKVNQFTRYN